MTLRCTTARLNLSSETPSAARVAALFLAYEEGDRNPPMVPGGQGGKPQRTQTPALRRKRQRKHQENRAQDNKKSILRYQTDYKRKPKMKKRQPLYR